MKNPSALPFSLRFFIALITIICSSITFFSHARTCLAKRVAERIIIQLHSGEIAHLFEIDNPGTTHAQTPFKDYGKESSSLTRKIADET